jgi:prefoldin subunit 4
MMYVRVQLFVVLYRFYFRVSKICFVGTSNTSLTPNEMASKKDTNPIDVQKDDQNNICTFSRQHRRFTQLQKMIVAKKKNIQDISDATDEVFISDEIRFVFGETFVTVDATGAEELLGERAKREKGELADLEAELKQLEEDMKARKAQLYAKFGSQIYLENE